MPYNCHGSTTLIQCFKDKPWQGTNPEHARYIFVGIDANFIDFKDNNIAGNPFFQEIIHYLNDGVDWQNKNPGFHHPFMLPCYQGKRDGRRYHEKFATIGFTPSDAVSFVELLHLPTTSKKKELTKNCGPPKKKTGKSVLMASDLVQDHLIRLVNWFDNGSAKYIFLSPTVTRIMKQRKEFRLLFSTPESMDDKLKDLKIIRKKNGQTIYEIYHFSVHYKKQLEVLGNQIAQIKTLL